MPHWENELPMGHLFVPKGGGKGTKEGTKTNQKSLRKKEGGQGGTQGTRWGVQDDPEGGAGAKSMKNQWFLLLFEGVLGRAPRSHIENRTLA